MGKAKPKPSKIGSLSVQEFADVMAKGLTIFAFRNGPIENMHANGQLSQEDMKTLNKNMVNHLAALIEEFHEGRPENVIRILYTEYLYYAQSWDKAEPDKEVMAKLIEVGKTEFSLPGD